jgi:hypothetical protein
MKRIGFLALVIVFALVGCAGLEQFPEVSENYAEDLKSRDPTYHKALTDINAAKDKPQEQVRIRNEEIERRLAVININFAEFETALAQENVQVDFGIALAGIGVGAVGAFVSETASQVLSAASAGLAGGQAAYRKAALFDQTFPALLAQMRAGRNQVRVRIYEGMTRSYEQYPLSMAQQDLKDFIFAGSLPGAIVATAEDAQVKNARAENQIVKISQRRSEEFMAPDRQDRVDALLDAIANLDDPKAIELEKSPPVQDAEVDQIVSLRDPTNQRAINADVAREMLKLRAVMSQRDDESLDAWETSVKASE